jgi:hypothetical protein
MWEGGVRPTFHSISTSMGEEIRENTINVGTINLKQCLDSVRPIHYNYYNICLRTEFLKLTTCCTVLKREISEKNVSTTDKSMKWKFLGSQELKKNK